MGNLSGPISGAGGGGGGGSYVQPSEGSLLDGLVSYYDHGGIDRVGSNDLSTPGGTPGTTTGKVSATCMDFDEPSNQYYFLADADAADFEPNKTWSAAFWYLSGTIPTAGMGLWGKYAAAPDYCYLYINQFRSRTVRITDWQDSTGLSGDTIWRHMYMAWDNDTLTAYRTNDGRRFFTSSGPRAPAVSNTGDFYLGGLLTGNILPFDGQIDQWCYWNRLLTGDEQSLLWNQGDGYDFLNA